MRAWHAWTDVDCEPAGTPPTGLRHPRPGEYEGILREARRTVKVSNDGLLRSRYHRKVFDKVDVMMRAAGIWISGML